jgi:hypothetical protein
MWAGQIKCYNGNTIVRHYKNECIIGSMIGSNGERDESVEFMVSVTVTGDPD